MQPSGAAKCVLFPRWSQARSRVLRHFNCAAPRATRSRAVHPFYDRDVCAIWRIWLFVACFARHGVALSHSASRDEPYIFNVFIKELYGFMLQTQLVLMTKGFAGPPHISIG